MRILQKILVTALATASLSVLLTGCTSSTSYTYKVDTGDKITIKLDTTGGYSISSKNPFEISKDGSVISQGTFIEKDAYEQYVSTVENDENAEIIDSGKKDENEYVFWSYGGEEYDYVIKVGDSDTGVLLGSQESEEAAKEVFNRLTITEEK